MKRHELPNHAALRIRRERLYEKLGQICSAPDATHDTMARLVSEGVRVAGLRTFDPDGDVIGPLRLAASMGARLFAQGALPAPGCWTRAFHCAIAVRDDEAARTLASFDVERYSTQDGIMAGVLAQMRGLVAWYGKSTDAAAKLADAIATFDAETRDRLWMSMWAAETKLFVDLCTDVGAAAFARDVAASLKEHRRLFGRKDQDRVLGLIAPGTLAACTLAAQRGYELGDSDYLPKQVLELCCS